MLAYIIVPLKALYHTIRADCPLIEATCAHVVHEHWAEQIADKFCTLKSAHRGIPRSFQLFSVLLHAILKGEAAYAHILAHTHTSVTKTMCAYTLTHGFVAVVLYFIKHLLNILTSHYSRPTIQ